MSAPQAPHRLNFPELDREIEVQGEETIFHGARRNGLRIVGACGGRGTCGTCVVRVVEGRIDHIHSAGPDLLETDDDAAGADSPAPGRRKWLRACQLRVRSDCTIEVAPRSLAPVVRADVDLGDAGETLPLDPAVSQPGCQRPRGDALRYAFGAMPTVIARALDMPLDAVDLQAAVRLPQVMRDGGWSLRVFRRGRELIGVAPAGSRTLGLAVDLGTTNAAGFLVDLESGARLASLGIENPQTAWGADLISRINHATRAGEGGEELRMAAVAALNALAHDLCRAVGAHIEEIVDAWPSAAIRRCTTCCSACRCAARPRALRRRRARCRRCEGARTGAGGARGPGCTWRRSSAASSAATM
jgi:uncharacterized 2Fe-2S/4Fe-4S cluster protein (DUF4445 family)